MIKKWRVREGRMTRTVGVRNHFREKHGSDCPTPFGEFTAGRSACSRPGYLPIKMIGRFGRVNFRSRRSGGKSKKLREIGMAIILAKGRMEPKTLRPKKRRVRDVYTRL